MRAYRTHHEVTHSKHSGLPAPRPFRHRRSSRMNPLIELISGCWIPGGRQVHSRPSPDPSRETFRVFDRMTASPLGEIKPDLRLSLLFTEIPPRPRHPAGGSWLSANTHTHTYKASSKSGPKCYERSRKLGPSCEMSCTHTHTSLPHHSLTPMLAYM